MSGVPAVPQQAQGGVANQLHRARSRAIDAMFEAEEAEKVARRKRRAATSQLRAYEHMLEEYSGQLTIEEVT